MKYSNIIEKTKRKNVYISYDVLGDYKKAWEYRDVLSGIGRIKLWFHKTFPYVYSVYRKIKQ